MTENPVELLIGDLREKRGWHELQRRVRQLPKEYRRAHRHIMHYLFVRGTATMEVLGELVTLFETSAAQDVPVRQLTGEDAAAFADEFADAFLTGDETAAQRLNREIREYFDRQGTNRC